MKVSLTGGYKDFFRKYAKGVGTKIAAGFSELLYESDPRGGIENRARYNRHRLAHGISPDAVTVLDLISGCMILDMIVSTAETSGDLLSRILR